MLTRGDDYPIHQTAEPIAYAGTDRNFYDRYFFNGYTADGEIFFALAFGVYPHANLADAHFSVLYKDVQHNVHASCFLNMERLDLCVGPVRIVVERALHRLRILVASTDGIAADLSFEGRSFPIEEPRFTRRIGPRSFFDYTRMTQNGRYTGWLELDGVRKELPLNTLGTRDRSWGVRPIGAPDAQPITPPIEFSFFWVWTPLNFPDASVFFHDNADAAGVSFNRRAAIMPDGGGARDVVETSNAELAMVLVPGTRHAASATLTISPAGRAAMRLEFAPFRRFQMSGIGYGHPEWAHGMHHGSLAVEVERVALCEVDVTKPVNLHVQMLSRVTLDQENGVRQHGIGVFEHVILGPYEGLGLIGFADPAPPLKFDNR